MYTEKAIERLNNIDWNNVGENGSREDVDLGCEFVRRMAVFCKENNIQPTYPFMTNIASYFSDSKIDEDVLNKCNDCLRDIIENPSFSRAVVSYYLQASLLADEDSKYVECINVYEPLILVFEKGGGFLFREAGMSFFDSGLIPLHNWFERFKDKSDEYIDIHQYIK